ncbi:MAG TPA: pseudouridine synthase [Candidatus Limnocylindria bacterium]|nr:pseudouridine synthase [Candidatus Limnocylindria bacterium]
MPEERIQKVIAAAGVASRRQAEVLVATGRVRIDGKVAVVGQKVDPMVSTIDVNGTPIGVGVARAYVALHKPAGVTSTTRDRHADTTVLDLIPTALFPDGTRLYPVGRLDLDSEGLLLLTNDGDWAERVLHPRFGVEREYALALAQPLVPEQVRLLNAGIRLDEGLGKLSAPLRATTSVENRQLADALDPAPDHNFVWYRATLAQGWKRQLRRMFGAVDAPILRLVRVRIGIVRLGDLRSGRARNLKAPEIKGLAALGGTSAWSGPVRGGRKPHSAGVPNAAPTSRTPRDASGSIRFSGRPGGIPSGPDYPTGIAGDERKPRRSAEKPSRRGERTNRSSRHRET